MAKKNPRIIGDFVWAGMDYLGEVGVGSWEYSDYAPDFSPRAGLDHGGERKDRPDGKASRGGGLYTRTAFELADRAGHRRASGQPHR